MPSPISYKVSDHKVKLVLSIDRYASQRERGRASKLVIVTLTCLSHGDRKAHLSFGKSFQAEESKR